jgi:putative ABC transport system permease protein
MDFRPYVREQLAALAVAREADIVEELAQHLEDVYCECVDAGLGHEAARARAMDTLPAAIGEMVAALRSTSRTPGERIADRWRAALDEPGPGGRESDLMTDLRRDCRYALRTLFREPGLTAVIVLTLALGIGATAATFSAIDAVLLRRAPVADADRVVNAYTVWSARATANRSGDQLDAWSYPDYADVRDSAVHGGVLSGLATWANITLSLDAHGLTEAIPAALVSGNYFEVLGVRPVQGRGFDANEDRVGSPARVVVLSHRLWQQRFGGDAAIVGRSTTLSGQTYVVVGIAPRGFTGLDLGEAADAWVPMALQDEVRPPSPALRRRLAGMTLLQARDVRWLNAAGRLRRDRSLADTAAALDVIGRRLSAAYPDSNQDLTVTVRTLGDGPGLRRDARPMLAVLGVAVTLVLVIACANVASLLLARAVTRRREVAVRVAMGAGRGQLVRQWLTEAVILGLLGGAAGLVVAMVSTPLLHRFAIPEAIDLSLNLRVLAFTLATGVATGLLFGLAPVLQLIGRDTLTALRDEGGGVATGIRATRVRSAFVVLQVALSLVLLVGAGLFLRTVQEAYAVELGYRIDHMLIADVDLGSRYTPEQSQTFHGELLERVNALPGVVAAGAARVTVLSGVTRTMPVSVDGQPIRRDGGNVIPARANVVSDRYLEAMGIALVRGRGFQASDGRTSAPVAIVSRSLANRLWPNVDPIGQRLVSLTPATVVGVVADTVYRSTVERDPRPVFYLSLAQSDEAAVSLHVRTAGDPLATLPAIRQAVRDLDPRVAVTRPRRLADELDRSVTEQRAMATFVGVLSGIALLLAAVGLYGVMAHAARQRTAEIGLRLALGATPASIVSLVVARGARLVSLGAALGVVAAFLGVRFVRNRLFGVEPTDPLTWIAVSAALISIALVACVIPARRAMRVNPTVALRG